MSAITIMLPDERLLMLREMANNFGVTPEELVQLSVEDLLTRPDEAFLQAVDRVLETIERFEEDLTDKARVHGHLKAVIQVGEAIEVDPRRPDRSAADPLMTRLEQDLQGMLDKLALESPLVGDV